MKYIYLPLFASVILSLNGCKKKNDPAPVLTSTISFKVDGVTKQITHAVALNGDLFSIGGLTSTESIAITIDNRSNTDYPIHGLETGTYNLENSFDAIQMNYSLKSPNTVYFGETGSLKITYLTSDRIKGTFEFIATDTSGLVTKAITDGYLIVR